MTTENYAEHIATLTARYSDALEFVADQKLPIDATLVHSGTEQHYYSDDRGVPFQAYGHLLNWLPVNRPNQFVLFQPGEKPIYFQIVPSDFWYEQDIHIDPAWEEQFTIVRLSNLDQLSAELRRRGIEGLAYIGEDGGSAAMLGIEPALVNPPSLLAFLDFARGIKTEYELDQLRSANRLALLGHAAARTSFFNGGSEYDIHMAYLQAAQILEDESPYTNIVALNEKAAILHYQFKRKTLKEKGRVLLIDAGCRVRAYGSDITRTSVSEDAHPVFKSLCAAMEQLELALLEEVTPGTAYQSLHASALKQLAAVLLEHDICRGSASELSELNIPQLFMPHGVGHLLGIQVHDVGGHQSDRSGAVLSPPPESPALRNTRTMEPNMVFTVEPGLYFIPLLLEPERDSERGKKINWKLVDELYPSGGIRIEDNIRVTDIKAENLTRQFEQVAQ